MDTDGIQISKKIEFKQNIIYSINEGFHGHSWYSNFKEIEFKPKPVYNKNEGFKRHKLYSNS